MPKYGSLFAGVGGFDIGFDAAGWECGFQVEWDKHCQQVLTHHWPEVPKWWDVSEVNGAELPPVDLITFGSPCQDLSLAGKRAGLEGSRSNLFFEATRIIQEMRNATNGQYPRWAIWENVAGAFSSNGGKDFDAVLQEMVNIGGHHVEWHCLDAQFFGVPQRRRRVFVIACFDSSILSRSGQALLPVSEGGRRNTKKGIKKGKDTPLAFGESVNTGGPELGSGEQIANTISASLYHHGTVVNQDANNGHVVIDDNPVLMRQREGKPGGGKGPLFSDSSLTLSGSNDQILFQPNAEPYVKVVRSGARDADGNLPPEVWRDNEVAPTLNVFDNTGESRATVVIAEPMLIDGTRVDDVRVYESPVQTLAARMGTGGNNVPMVAQETIPIQDGREIEKHQNGLGIGEAGDPSYTLDQTGAQAVAYPIQGTIIGRSDTAGPQGRGVGEDGDPMYTLDTISAHGVAYTPTSFAQYAEGVGTLRENGGDLGGGSESLIVEPDIAPTLRSGGDGGVPSSRGEHLVVEAYDEYNDVLGGDVHHALRAGTKQSTGVVADMVVRRLTPVECERLMGWPDNHTLYRADGTTNSDTTRYKMCGNGVASPVAQWIAEHLLPIHESLNP